MDKCSQEYNENHRLNTIKFNMLLFLHLSVDVLDHSFDQISSLRSSTYIFCVNTLLREGDEQGITDKVRVIVQTQIAEHVATGAEKGRRIGDVLARNSCSSITCGLKKMKFSQSDHRCSWARADESDRCELA